MITVFAFGLWSFVLLGACGVFWGFQQRKFLGRGRFILTSKHRPGERLTVYPGQTWDFDGVLVHGRTWADESNLTGESQPVAKGPGDPVFAGTRNLHGTVETQVEQVGSDTVLALIVSLVRSHQPRGLFQGEMMRRLGLSVAGVTVAAGVVAGISGVTDALWAWIALAWVGTPLASELGLFFWRQRAFSWAAKRGVLFKKNSAFKELAAVKFVYFDKTGTLTQGRPEASALEAFGDFNYLELLSWAAAVEKDSEHPLGRAVVERAQREKLPIPLAENVTDVVGKGREGILEGRLIRVGSRDFHEPTEWPTPVYEKRWLSQARTLLYVTRDGVPVGVIACEDPIRPEAAGAVLRLQKAGIGVGLLTGDKEGPARALAERMGLENWEFSVTPEQKAQRILAHAGGAAFVGDGVNDAPALSGASPGVAMGKGAVLARRAGTIVLLNESLTAFTEAVFWTRLVEARTAQIPLWSKRLSFVLVVAVLVAGFWGGWDKMGLQAASLGALGLLWPLFLPGLKKEFQEPVSEQQIEAAVQSRSPKEPLMVKKIYIDGMSCAHCATRIEKAIAALEGVSSVKVDLAGRFAEVETAHELDMASLQGAVDAAGYHVVKQA
jgi:P-type E1-E2 ATPase